MTVKSGKTKRDEPNETTAPANGADPPGGGAEAAPTVLLELPVGEIPPEAYLVEHADMQMTHTQAEALRRIIEGCKRDRAELRTGRLVQSPSEALRWVLEQAAEAMG